MLILIHMFFTLLPSNENVNEYIYTSVDCAFCGKKDAALTDCNTNTKLCERFQYRGFNRNANKFQQEHKLKTQILFL